MTHKEAAFSGVSFARVSSVKRCHQMCVQVSRMRLTLWMTKQVTYATDVKKTFFTFFFILPTFFLYFF